MAFKTINPETINSRKRDISLTVHFLHQCHMVFLPWPHPFRRLEAVLSPFILMGEINVITDNTYREKIKFVRDLSLSQQQRQIYVKTYIKQISCNTKFICFNPFTQCFLKLPDKAEGGYTILHHWHNFERGILC